MSLPLVGLLLMAAVFLTLYLEKSRGTAEPYKVKELEDEIKRLEGAWANSRELCQLYKDQLDEANAEIKKLKNEMQIL